MSESRCAIARLNQSHPSAVARGERSCRVGDRGYESPMHMTAGIAISRYPISRRAIASPKDWDIERSKTPKHQQRLSSGHKKVVVWAIE
jgi:hypothetical protein